MTNKPRGLWIAGNWKMNHGPEETRSFFSALKTLSQRDPVELPSGVRVCLIPPAVSLERALTFRKELSFPVEIAAQNAHWEKKGAFTGELSGPMLREIGIEWVLIGHSERRQYFGETDETVRKKTQSLIEQGFNVILCVGETHAEREQGKTAAVLTRQMESAINSKNLVIAYEPVWAIGTGVAATAEQSEETHQFIRKNLWDRFGLEAAGRTPILYGGSVTPENARSFFECPNIDGALIGGASLKPENIVAFVRVARIATHS